MPREPPIGANMLRFRPPLFLSSMSQSAGQQTSQFPAFRPRTPEMADSDSDSSECAIYGHRRRRQRSGTLPVPHENVIDLTKDSPPRQSHATHFPSSVSTALASERPFKRRRVQHEEPSNASSSHRAPPSAPQVDLTAEEMDEASCEELDLTLIETEEELHQKRAEQRERHEHHQRVQDQQNHLVQESIQGQSDRSQGPLRLGESQCVICMETMTNMTATRCGRLCATTSRSL